MYYTKCRDNSSHICFQAPLIAPSNQSEDVLDLEQVSLQETPLPPPIQRVMDPGQFRYAVDKDDNDLSGAECVFVFPGFSDTDLAAMNPDAADLLDRLDVSTSSIDMTYTSLAMHEEKDSEISGVGELIHDSSDQCPGAFMCRLKLIKTVFDFLLYRGAGGQCIALVIRRQPD